MPTALLADAHLGGSGGEAEPLIAQLEGLRSGCERLVLLGDLFRVWVGHRKFETREIARVVAALRRLRAQGLPIHYLEGNRDFFLAGSAYADAFTSVGDEVTFTAGGRRCLAVHGDGLNDRDWQYLFWRLVSKSAPARWLVRALPAALARRLVLRTERRLAQTNFRHRFAIPERALRRYAERRLREGHDLLILGHFHEQRRFAVAGGEVWLVEAWFSSRRVEWL